MPPNEIGAAAAYEVFRTWRYHYGIIAQPLSGDRERQREALIGLAVGEGKSASDIHVLMLTLFLSLKLQGYGSSQIDMQIKQGVWQLSKAQP